MKNNSQIVLNHKIILNEVNDGIIIVNNNGEILFANRKAAEISGYGLKRLPGFNLNLLLSPEEFIKVMDIFKKRFAGIDVPEKYETVFLANDGTEIPVELTAKIIEMGNEKVDLVIFRDIYERKMVEKKLIESREEYRELFNNALVGMFRMTEDSKWLACNDMTAEMLGYDSKEEFMNSANVAQHFVNPDDRVRMLSIVMKKGCLRDFEIQMQRKDGTKFWALFGISYYRETGVLEGVFIDITQRKQAEEGIKELEKKNRELLENLNSVIILLSKDGTIQYINDFGINLFGFSKDELIGKNVVGTIVPETESSGRDLTILIRDIRTNPEKYEYIENENCTRDGRRLWFHWRNKALYDDYGALTEILSVGNDYTELKQMEEYLQYLKKSIDVSNDAMFWSDPDGKFYYVNEAACISLGYTREELLGITVFDMNPNATKEKWNDVWRILRERKFIHRESIHRRKDGSEFPVEITSTYVKVGNKEYNCGFVRDISIRKQMEAQLRESEEQYRLLFETSPFGIGIAEQSGQIIIANTAMELLVGYSTSEMHSMNLADIYERPSQRQETLEELRTNGNVRNREVRIKKADGTIRDVRLNIDLVDLAGHNEPVLMTIIEDITERKKIERDYNMSETKYHTLFDHAPLGFTLSSFDGSRIEINNEICAISGYTREEFLKTSPDSYFADINQRKDFIQELKNKKRIKRHEMLFKKFDGTLFPAYVSAILLPEIGSELFFTIIEDITDQKKKEEERRQLEEKLIQSQKMEAIGTLAGGIAHDFNNILAIIIGNLEYVNTAPSMNTESSKESIQDALTASGRAKDLIQQILTFSRRSVINKQPLDIAVILKETLKLLRASLPSTIDIKTNIQLNGCKILADPVQIHQIVMNLCTNAFHAMKETGGVLTVGLTSKTIESTECDKYKITVPGPYIVLNIRDTGHGIPNSIINRIYEPYFTAKKFGEGTGLGLSVVHGIIKNHDGGISVASEEGKGTEFTIVFPIFENKSINQDIHAETSYHGEGLVLIVDDEEMICKAIKNLLSMLGFTAITANNGAQALNIFNERQKEIRLIITDLTMPVMTGIVLAQHIRKTGSKVPIILMSGYSEDALVERTHESEIDYIIYKPISINDVVKILKQLNGGISNGELA